MASLRHMIHQGNIAALQKAIGRTLSETYEVDTALDMWMLKLLQQLEEDEERGDMATTRPKLGHPAEIKPSIPH